MTEADKVALISMDLYIKEVQPIKITNDMPSMDYIYKDVPSPAIVKPPNPNSNGF